MLTRLKKFFNRTKKEPVIEQEELNKELLDLLDDVVYSDVDLNKVLQDSVSSIFLMSVYTEDIHDLGLHIYNPSNNVKLMAVSISHYFKDTSDIRTTLFRIRKVLFEKKLIKYVEHDLYEILRTLRELGE